MNSALEGIRVLDLTQIMAGPFCTMMLADLGADVIKIEKPAGGDDSRRMGEQIAGESAAFMSLNRNKRSIVVDIRTPGGAEILWHLIETADVLVENFRPGTLLRLGFGYDAVHAKNPRLIYCSISGFGQTGPLRDSGGFDLIAQAMSGVLAVTGTKETPSKVGVPIADLNAGLFASHAILAALIARGKTGQGQYVETSLLEAAMAYTIWESNEYWVTGRIPERLGTAHRASAPYQVFATKNGLVAIGAANQRTWEKLVEAIQRPELLQNPHYASNLERMSHRAELVAELSAIFQTLITEEWLHRLDAAGVPSGPVLTADEVYQHPQVQAREMVISTHHPVAGLVRNIGFPVKYSLTPGKLERAAPILGQHTSEILYEIGYSETDIKEFATANVIRAQ